MLHVQCLLTHQAETPNGGNLNSKRFLSGKRLDKNCDVAQFTGHSAQAFVSQPPSSDSLAVFGLAPWALGVTLVPRSYESWSRESRLRPRLFYRRRTWRCWNIFDEPTGWCCFQICLGILNESMNNKGYVMPCQSSRIQTWLQTIMVKLSWTFGQRICQVHSCKDKSMDHLPPKICIICFGFEPTFWFFCFVLPRPWAWTFNAMVLAPSQRRRHLLRRGTFPRGRVVTLGVWNDLRLQRAELPGRKEARNFVGLDVVDVVGPGSDTFYTIQ